jgi:hypothetical protein
MTLLPELIAAYRFARRPKFRNALERRGLAFGGDYLWGVAHVAVDSLFYEPDPEGAVALIVGAFEFGALIDLVAVSSVFGLRTRRGEADLLGHDALEAAGLHGKPLDLYADPWSWLRHDCRGATIVNWRAAPSLLRNVPRIRCESTQLAERVDQAFARPIPCPPLLVFSPKQAPKET